MSDTQKFINVYSGTEVQVIILKGLLENINIEGIIQNDFRSGVLAGFGSGTASTVRLKIHESDLEKARPIIEEFVSNN
jgi:hypothetical protein